MYLTVHSFYQQLTTISEQFYLVVYDSIYFEAMCSCSETIFRCDFDVFGYKYWFLTCLEPSWEWQLVLHVLLTRSPLNIRSHTYKSCSSDTTPMSTTAIVTQLCVHPCNDPFNRIALCSWNDSVMIQAERGLDVTYEAITSLILTVCMSCIFSCCTTILLYIRTVLEIVIKYSV